MKKMITLMLAFALFACSDDDTTFVAPVSNNFVVTFDDSYGNEPASDVDITLVNNEDGKTYNLVTDSQGIATIEVVPGTYKVNASLVLSAEAYEVFTGQSVENDISFNASLEELQITSETLGNTELVLVTGKLGDLLIKQIYYSGSDAQLGALFRDQFFEIYNNSNEDIYLDGLYFAQVYGASSISSNLTDYHLPNGQFDWSQSLYQNYVDTANSDFIYADEVLQFPGSGEDYLLEARKSVIVAATAVNHKAPLTVIDDEGEEVTYSVPEPQRTVDLSQAPFEAYYRTYQEAQGSNYLDSDIDNPNSVNMEIAFKSFSGKDLILDVHGRDAFVIFKAEAEIFAQWDALPLPSITADNYTEITNTYLQIPVDVIIDGVETQRNDPSKAKPKRLTDAIDAGEIATILGAYSSESVIRKISKEINGVIFYQDTNNSTNDFEVLAHPQVEIE